MSFLKDLFKPKKQEQPIENKPILNKKFAVQNVKNHLKDLNQLIECRTKLNEIEPFKGYSDDEIIEIGCKATIYGDYKLDGASLGLTDNKGKKSLDVLLNDGDGNWFKVGNIAKTDLPILLPYMDNDLYDIKIKFTITGGLTKYISDDQYGDDYLQEHERNYGIELYIKIWNKRD